MIWISSFSAFVKTKSGRFCNGFTSKQKSCGSHKLPQPIFCATKVFSLPIARVQRKNRFP
jgi:hypothetical protein